MHSLSLRKEKYAYIIMAVVVGAFFQPALSGTYLTFGGDDTLLHLPIRAYSFAQLKRGSFPFWTPHLYSGYPLFASGQAGTLYPLNLLFLFLHPMAAMEWSRALHLFLGGSILFYLLQKVKDNCFLNLSISLFWMLILRRVPGIAILHLMVWLPLLSESWLLFSLKGKRELLTPVIGSILIFAGNAQYALQAHLFLLALILFDMTIQKAPFQKLLSKVFWLAIVEVGIASVQLFPFLRLLAHSERAHGLSFHYAAQGTTPLPIFFTLLFLLSATGRFLYIQKEKRALSFWSASLFALLLSSSLSLPLQRLLRAIIPFYSATRIPEKWLLFSWFGLLMSIGIGFRRRNKSPFWLLPLLLIALFLNLNPKLPRDGANNLTQLLSHQKKSTTAGRDLRVFAQRQALLALPKEIAEMRGKQLQSRWTNSNWEVSPLAPNFNLLYHIPLLEGYLALVPRYFRALTLRPLLKDGAPQLGLPISPYIADSFGVRFFVTLNPRKPSHPISVHENKTAYPLWYFAEETFSLASLKKIVNAMRSFQPKGKKTVFLLGSAHRATLPKGEVLSVTISDQTMSFQVKTYGKALFVFSEWRYPGWHTRIDGRKTSTIQVNALQQGLWIPKGQHLLQLTYFPDLFSPLLLLCLVTLTLLSLYSLSARAKRVSIRRS